MKKLLLCLLLALPLSASARVIQLGGVLHQIEGFVDLDRDAGEIADWDLFLPGFAQRLYKAPCDFDPTIGGCTPPTHYAFFEPNHLVIGTFGSPAQTTTLELNGGLFNGNLLRGTFTTGGASGETFNVSTVVIPEAQSGWFFAAGAIGLLWRGRRAWAKWH